MARQRELSILNIGGARKRRGSSTDGGDFFSPTDPNMTNQGTVAHSETRPQDAYAALMECAPGIEPDSSLAELSHLRDIIQDAIDHALTDRERWVFDGLYSRRASLRDIGRELSLSKSQVHNIANHAKVKLATALIEHEEIRRHLGAE